MSDHGNTQPEAEPSQPLLSATSTDTDQQGSKVTSNNEDRSKVNTDQPTKNGAIKKSESQNSEMALKKSLSRETSPEPGQMVVTMNGVSTSPPQSVHSGPAGRPLVTPVSMSLSSLLTHRIKMEEVVPSASSIVDDKQDWQMSLQIFSNKKRNAEEDKKLPKRVRRYYKLQDELITSFEEMQLEVDDAMENAEEHTKLKSLAGKLAKATFFINLLLLIGKSVAAGMSGSLSVISAVIDSAVDLVSGALMWWSNRAMKKRNPYDYPQGRTKLEPIAIVVLSVIMALASVQMVKESIEQIITYATKNNEGPNFNTVTIVICVCTIVIKFVLWLVCVRVKDPTIQALAQDHRNDVLSNTVALVMGFVGDRYWTFADPIGAIVISLYIIVSWFFTGWEQIKMLTGHTAHPQFLKKITWIALNHHPKVLLIDTVRAFHFGNNFLVEVDIVLPEEMSLRESHDIGESLQLKIERLPEVERAFVHLDYECEHHPNSEHKVV